MLFISLNIFIGIVLIFTSFSIDKNEAKNTSHSSLVNLILFLGVIFFLMAFTLFLNFRGMRQLALFVGRVSFMFSGWFSVMIFSYLMFYPDYKKSKALNVLNFLLFVACGYIMFFSPKGFKIISIANIGAMMIESSRVFTGPIGEQISITWFELFNLVYKFLLPAFGCLMVITRAENVDVRLQRQNMLLNVLGSALSWGVFAYIRIIEQHSIMAIAVSNIGFIPAVFMFVCVNSKDEIWDKKITLRAALRVLLFYFLPTAVISLVFCFLWQVEDLNLAVYGGLVFVSAVVVVAFVILLKKKFQNNYVFRDSRYAVDFENEITKLDYNMSPQEVTGQVYNIFKNYVGTESLKILIDNGEGMLEQVYSSDGSKMENVFISDPCFDSMQNAHVQILFRTLLKETNSLSSIKSNLTELLNNAGSEALILLTEGRQIIGAIFLGKKESGNPYSEYDLEVFKKLYSNFFVIGYYVKNIMNEDVVGTVNREIRMSGQIITSIQENMDIIKSNKVEVGYQMVPAHNIGGEFVDMIRLTDTRHIFIIGAVNGKGIAASMAMIILKSIIRTFLAETTDFKKLVEKVNSFIRESLPKGTYFAGTFGLLDFNTDTLYYINCGSPAIFVYTRAYNNVIEIQGEGRILGFAKDISSLIKVKKVKLAEGDIILTCTDGLIETRSLRGESYGKSRVQTNIMENTGYPADRMVRFTYESLVKFASKELDEDITMLILKYKGEE